MYAINLWDHKVYLNLNLKGFYINKKFTKMIDMGISISILTQRLKS